MSGRKTYRNRSQWAGDSGDEATPSSSNNGHLTAEEMQARMAAADYGTARQHQLSTAVRRDQRPIATSRTAILAARDCNVAGTEAAENARANQDRLQSWSTVGKLDDNEDDGMTNIAGGQTHRMRVRGELRQQGDIQEPSRLSGSGDARQLYGSSRVTAPVQAPAYGSPRNHSPTKPDVIEQDTADLPQLTNAEWHEVKRIYDELQIPHIKPRTSEEIDAARERLYTKSKPNRPARPAHPTPPLPSTPARNRPTRAPPVNNAWAPGNLVVNPTPPLNLSNPSVTTTVEDMRTRLGSNFIETSAQEDTSLHTGGKAKPVEELTQEHVARPPNPFDLSEPSIIALEKDMQRDYGCVGIETAVVEASIASAQSASAISNPFDTPDALTQPHTSTPATRPDEATDRVEEVASATDNDKLLELLDAKLNDFHITNKSRTVEPSVTDDPTTSGEVNLMEFREEASELSEPKQESPDLLTTQQDNILLLPLEPAIARADLPTQSVAVSPEFQVSEDKQVEEETGSSVTPAIAAVFTEPLPYMGTISAFHQEVLATSDAFWAEQVRRRERERASAPVRPPRSLNSSRWAPATHTPPRNDNA